MNVDVSIERVGPERFAEHREAVAALRIEIFRSYPYLYDGDLEYEARYLEAYDRSPDAVWVLARQGGALVGVSTGLPLAAEDASFAEPFVRRGIDPEVVFYFGESVLRPALRGQGLGHRFFDEREGHARALGRFELTAFAAVDRPADHPRRPADYRDLGPFWQRRGYSRRDDMKFRLAWKELDEAEESDKTMTYWLRPLRADTQPAVEGPRNGGVSWTRAGG